MGKGGWSNGIEQAFASFGTAEAEKRLGMRGVGRTKGGRHE